MKNIEPKKGEVTLPKSTKSSDFTSTDNDADKTGTDKDSDSTDIGKSSIDANKFGKPKREVDPDRTGIDTDADITKKEK